MARGLTFGWEWNDPSTGTGSAQNSAVDPFQNGSGVTYSTTIVRSGTYAGKCDSGVGNATAFWGGTGFSMSGVSVTYYLKVAIYFVNLPSADTKILSSASSATCSMKIRSTGVVFLDDNNVQIGSNGPTLTTGQWYVLELASVNGAGGTIVSLEGRVDGASFASAATAAARTPISGGNYGWITAPGASKVCYCDDFILNDSTGANENTWPSTTSKVVLLLPISDSAGGAGWTLGTGTALGGNGFQAVNNTPDVGVADLTAGSDTKQLRNASSNANSAYDANLTSYTTAGIGAADTINTLLPLCATAAPVTTSAKTGSLGIASNPAIGQLTFPANSGTFYSGVNAGTYPTGWKWSKGTLTYAPSVTLGTSPVARVNQITSSTRIAMVSDVGMYVDYTPSAAVVYVPRSPGVDSGFGNF